jgi:hypothetical protein
MRGNLARAGTRFGDAADAVRLDRVIAALARTVLFTSSCAYALS